MTTYVGQVDEYPNNTLNNLNDTKINQPLGDGHVLAFNAQTGKWENEPPSEAHPTTLYGLTDTTVPQAPWTSDNGGGNEQFEYSFLRWDNQSQTWIDSKLETRNLTDVFWVDPAQDTATGSLMVWDQPLERWNVVPASSSGIILSDLANVAGIPATNGDVLTYNQSLTRWEPAAPTVAPHALDEHTDVAYDLPLVGGQLLRYLNGSWENHTMQLFDLYDVNLASFPIADGEILTYNSTFTRWENRAPTLTAHTLNEHTDADYPIALQGGQHMVFNSGTGKWENKVVSIEDLYNVDYTAVPLATGQVLTYNSALTRWENQEPAAVPTTLTALTDTTIITPAPNQVLTWSGSAWINQAPTIAAHALVDHTDVQYQVAPNDLADGNQLAYSTAFNSWINVPPYTLGVITTHPDVTVTAPTVNQLLVWDGVSQWVNGGINLGNLLDVNSAGLADGKMIQYSTTTSEWIMVDPPADITTLAGLTDTTITAPATNQVLTWSGSAWINQALPAGVTTLTGLTDTTIGGLALNQVLTWNGATWINQDVRIGTLTGGGTSIKDVSTQNPLKAGQMLVSTATEWVPTEWSQAGVTVLGRQQNGNMGFAFHTLTNGVWAPYGTGSVTASGATITSFGSGIFDNPQTLGGGEISLAPLTTSQTISVEIDMSIDFGASSNDVLWEFRLEASDDSGVTWGTTAASLMLQRLTHMPVYHSVISNGSQSVVTRKIVGEIPNFTATTPLDVRVRLAYRRNDVTDPTYEYHGNTFWKIQTRDRPFVYDLA